MLDLWKTGNGITILQLFYEASHYEAHAREFAIIKAIGLKNITNIVNGTPYGAIKEWNSTEIVNFGRMILYNALTMCIIEPPRVIQHTDVVLPNE